MSHPETITLFLSSIRALPEVQMRASINEAITREYADSMKDGDIFDPIEVIFDAPSGDYILCEGFHRYDAAKACEFIRIDARVVGEGGIEEAKYHALQANRKNSLRRTANDRERVIREALSHPKCKGMTETALSKLIGISRREIFRQRQKLEQPKNPGRTRDSEYTAALDVIRATCPTLADNITVGVVDLSRDETVRLAGKEKGEREALIPLIHERRVNLKAAEKIAQYIPSSEDLPMSTYLDFVARNPEHTSFLFRNTTVEVSFTQLD